jgi:hypothetical protein
MIRVRSDKNGIEIQIRIGKVGSCMHQSMKIKPASILLLRSILICPVQLCLNACIQSIIDQVEKVYKAPSLIPNSRGSSR